jgi:hypothetical protein
MAIRLLRQDDHQSDEAAIAQGTAKPSQETAGPTAAQAEVAPKRASTCQSGGYEQWLEDVEDEGLLLLIDDEIIGAVSLVLPLRLYDR